MEKENNVQEQTNNIEEQSSSIQERTKFCKHCGEKIPFDAVICIKCGRQVEELKKATDDKVIINNNNNVSASAVATSGSISVLRNKWVALILCIFLGIFGAHKFYEGKTGMGILYLFTGGLCGIGVIVDFIILLFKPTDYYVY